MEIKESTIDPSLFSLALFLVYWIFYLNFIWFLCLVISLHSAPLVKRERVQAKKITKDMRRKTLIIDKGTTECNNPQLNKLFYYFSVLFR